MMFNVDPITFEILKNAFKATANDINATLFRTAYSPVITSGRDIGTGIFTGDGRLVAHSDYDEPIFSGVLEFACKGAINHFKEEGISVGDIVIMNDPFVGGTHFNDVSVIRPIFYEGTLLAFVAVIGHWSDVGGFLPGSFAPNAREYYGEGLRIPPVKLYKEGKLDRDVYDLIVFNMRLENERKGDIRGQLSATLMGEKRLHHYVNKYGLDTVTQTMEEVIAYSERILRSEISNMPDGEYSWTDFIDIESLDFPYPKKVHLTIKKKGDEILFDFTGSDSESRSAANSTYPTTIGGIVVATKALFPEELFPMNHGCYEPLHVVAPEGTVVNAKPPAALSGMAATTYEKIIAVCLGAYSQMVPEKVMAAPYNLINLTIGGTDPSTRQQYVAYIYSEGGYGGRSSKDGNDALVSLYGGGARITPVEVYERSYPILFKEWRLCTDSGGPGKFRGGLGSVKRAVLTRGEAVVTSLGDRERFPAFGLFGGKHGAPQGLRLNIETENKNLTVKCVGYRITEGDEICIFSGGGGGYGDPFDRDPQMVLEDVIDEYCSIENAKKEYGVVIDPITYAINQEETLALRRLSKDRRKGAT